MTASFPASVWDGTTRIRPNFSVTREPAGHDFDRISEEIIAAQDHLKYRQGVPHFFSWYLQQNIRFLTFQANGGLTSLVTGQALASGTPINLTKNTSRVLIVANAGSVSTGTLTVTGDRINRNTGAVTGGGTEIIQMTGLTTNSSDTTALGTNRYQFTKAYMTEDWFRGSVVLSTTDLNLSDVDVYSISYEEFEDLTELEFDILDVSAVPNSTAAALDMLLFKVTWNPITKQSSVAILGEINTPATEVSAANQFIRLRRALDAEAHINYANREGWFLNISFYLDNQKYWDDVTVKIWGRIFFPLRLAT